MITKYMLKYMKLLNRFLLPIILIVGLGSTGIAEEEKLHVVTQTFPLEQANEVLEKLKTSKIDARAVLIL